MKKTDEVTSLFNDKIKLFKHFEDTKPQYPIVPIKKNGTNFNVNIEQLTKILEKQGAFSK